MCDEDGDRLIIDDNNDNDTNCSPPPAVENADAQKAQNKSFTGADPHKRRSVSPSTSSTSSSSSSSGSSSSSSSAVSFSLPNGQQLDKLAERPEKQQQVRKRKKEDIKLTTPRKNAQTNESVKNPVESENSSKKRKTEKPARTTANKHCQTDDLQQQSLKPDSNVLLDITIVFAPDPNTLYFTTKWKGRSYHGVITDGLSSKNQIFAQKRERAECLNGGKSGSGGAQNGQSPSLKRGKRGLNRAVIDRKGRRNNNLEDVSIFDMPDDLTNDNKASKLIKMQDGEAQKMLTRCPHKQCGHIFQTVNEVNQHLIFRHVTEPVILKETTASQYTPIATTSIGCDPMPELQKTTLCSKCREQVLKNKNEGHSKNDTKLPGQQKSSRNASPTYSDISADDAPTLIKEESFDKNDDNRQQGGLHFPQNPLMANKFQTPNTNLQPNCSAQSLTPRRTETSGSKAASNSSTPAPSSSTPLSTKLPKRSTLTPNIGMSQPQPQQLHPNQQTRIIHPTGFPMSFVHQQQQQLFNNHQQQQIFNLMNMVSASGGLQIPQPPTIKAGGSITAGSSNFGSMPQSSNIPGTSIGPGGIGIVHPQQLGALAVAANGMVTSSNASSTSSTSTPSSVAVSDAMRHKIHELKTGETSQNHQLLGINNIALQQQQQRNASPNTSITNVITSANSLQGAQQQLPFVRPTTSVAHQFPFFQRMPGALPPQQPFMNQQQMNMFTAAMMGGITPGQMMQQQPK